MQQREPWAHHFFKSNVQHAARDIERVDTAHGKVDRLRLAGIGWLVQPAWTGANGGCLHRIKVRGSDQDDGSGVCAAQCP